MTDRVPHTFLRYTELQQYGLQHTIAEKPKAFLQRQIFDLLIYQFIERLRSKIFTQKVFLFLLYFLSLGRKEYSRNNLTTNSLVCCQAVSEEREKFPSYFAASFVKKKGEKRYFTNFDHTYVHAGCLSSEVYACWLFSTQHE